MERKITISLKLDNNEYVFDDWKIEPDNWLPSRKLLTLNGVDFSQKDGYNLSIQSFGLQGKLAFYASVSQRFGYARESFLILSITVYPNINDWYSYGEFAIEDMKLKCDVVCKASTNLLSFI